jgi:3-deoxy-manno-octulosonate cytidylyltransferase (CMP-KDO synthetase)
MSGVVVVIPARYASKRFPGKILAPLAGRPLIAHVIDRARAARCCERLIVATDDQRIVDACLTAGAEAVLTDPDHASGTDRVAEVIGDIECSIIVNLQGDEPLVPPEAVDRCAEALIGDPEAGMATLAHPISRQAAADPNAVGVVCDRYGRALYFSRSVIPYQRDEASGADLLLRHVGIYGYRRATLLELAAAPPTPLEQAERLEQLRALEMGVRIRVEIVEWEAHGVDTPEDLARVEALIREGRTASPRPLSG